MSTETHHNEHSGTISTALVDPNALTREQLIRCHALTVANQRLGERTVEPETVTVDQLLNAAQKIADRIRAGEKS